MAYVADATRIKPGSIVKIERPLSSSGQPTSPHFFVVLSTPRILRPGELFLLVGVSSRINPATADPSKHVAMKWLNRKGGDPETGFSKPCFACVDFTHLLRIHKGESYPLELEAEFSNKFVRADKLQTLSAVMNAWNRRSEG